LLLDEVNQLQIQIVSTLIQQVLTLKHAALTFRERIEVNLQGGNIEVPFDRNFGIFGTFSFDYREKQQ